MTTTTLHVRLEEQGGGFIVGYGTFATRLAARFPAILAMKRSNAERGNDHIVFCRGKHGGKAMRPWLMLFLE
jgi:hypothetical protein